MRSWVLVICRLLEILNNELFRTARVAMDHADVAWRRPMKSLLMGLGVVYFAGFLVSATYLASGGRLG